MKFLLTKENYVCSTTLPSGVWLSQLCPISCGDLKHTVNSSVFFFRIRLERIELHTKGIFSLISLGYYDESHVENHLNRVEFGLP